jgi:hypothetical protein
MGGMEVVPPIPPPSIQVGLKSPDMNKNIQQQKMNNRKKKKKKNKNKNKKSSEKSPTI